MVNTNDNNIKYTECNKEVAIRGTKLNDTHLHRLRQAHLHDDTAALLKGKTPDFLKPEQIFDGDTELSQAVRKTLLKLSFEMTR